MEKQTRRMTVITLKLSFPEQDCSYSPFEVRKFSLMYTSVSKNLAFIVFLPQKAKPRNK